MDLINIPGIGKTTLEKLNAINIMSIEDMIFTFPVRYEINQLDDFQKRQINEVSTYEVEVIDKPILYFIRRKLTKLQIKVQACKVIFSVVIFNREYLSKLIKPGLKIVVKGKFIKNFSIFTASNLEFLSNFHIGIIPVYNLRDIPDFRVRKIQGYLLENVKDFKENLPTSIKKKRKFKDIYSVLKNIHQPTKTIDVEKARTRLAYQELLNFAVRVELINIRNQRLKTPIKEYNINKVKELILSLNFELTKDQKMATNDIFRDFKKQTIMNRLLQGDVGSGKTIVAILSAYAIVTAGYQVAVLAPTLVLAKQHYDTFKNYLFSYGVNIELLTSDINKTSRNAVLNNIKTGVTNIVIGTHSLLQEDIKFQNLGFVVIDEQQRFGVDQRRIIREKGKNPDILMMTATPIPRTLAISMFENTDVSKLLEKPSNRKNINTKIISFDELEKAFTVIEKELEDKHQVYVVCSLIEESKNRNNISVNEAKLIIRNRFNKAKIDILHGKMTDEEKICVLDSFYNQKTEILISTTVVEVGVNVKNATAILIFNASSFGLAQLHQLRGRVGRNDFSAYCYLVVDEEVEDIERLRILEKSNDGFEISEWDLSLRGPGEVFGQKQSGVPKFIFANLINDNELRDFAFEDAKMIINEFDQISKKIVLDVLKSIESYILD